MFWRTSNQVTYMTLSSHESGNRKKKCGWAIKLKGLLSMTHFFSARTPCQRLYRYLPVGDRMFKYMRPRGTSHIQTTTQMFLVFFSVLLVLSWEEMGKPPPQKKLYQWTSVVYNFWENIKGNANMPTPPPSNEQNFMVMIHALGF